MPLYKYKSFDEASKHLQQLLPADPVERLQLLEKKIKPLKPPRKIQRGIFRFKSLAEANAHREEQGL